MDVLAFWLLIGLQTNAVELLSFPNGLCFLSQAPDTGCNNTAAQ